MVFISKALGRYKSTACISAAPSNAGLGLKQCKGKGRDKDNKGCLRGYTKGICNFTGKVQHERREGDMKGKGKYNTEGKDNKPT